MGRHTRRVPAWVMGLILAAVVFALVILVLNALGYGDDPVVETLGQLAG